MSPEERVKAMVGKTIKAVNLTPDRESLTFEMDGGSFCFEVEGDCCSHSWIEHLDVPDKIAGATFLGANLDTYPMREPPLAEEPVQQVIRALEDNDYAEDTDIKVYQAHFKTSAGDIVMEFRNSSNGYYGGYVV